MQTQKVEGQWEIGLTIGGKEFPANPHNVVECNWFESVHQSLPSLNITVKDASGEFVSASAAGDGVIIEIALGDGNGGLTQAKFNIQGSPQVEHGGGYYLLKLNAVLDAIEYNRSVASGLFEGSSADAISQLAAKAGLTPQVSTSTSDSQVWLPTGKTIFGFAKEIANHGYASANSLMLMAVTDQRKLIYGDVNDLMKSGSIVFGADEAAGNIPINDWTGSSNGMVGNNVKAYGSTTYQFDAAGIVKELSSISSTLFGSVFGFSSGNSSRTGDLGARLDPKPRPAGNTHEKYQDAAHQNSRARAMFNVDLNLVTHRFSGAELLSGVQANPQNHAFSNANNEQINQTYAGRYLVTAKTKTLIGAKYAERLTLTTNGTSA